jgi:hypothetical protein
MSREYKTVYHHLHNYIITEVSKSWENPEADLKISLKTSGQGTTEGRDSWTVVAKRCLTLINFSATKLNKLCPASD